MPKEFGWETWKKREHRMCAPEDELLKRGVEAKVARGAALCTDHRDLPFYLGKFHSDWHSEFTPKRPNVFETDITLLGRAEVSLTTATPCRPQLSTVLGSVASKLSSHW